MPWYRGHRGGYEYEVVGWQNWNGVIFEGPPLTPEHVSGTAPHGAAGLLVGVAPENDPEDTHYFWTYGHRMKPENWMRAIIITARDTADLDMSGDDSEPDELQ